MDRGCNKGGGKEGKGIERREKKREKEWESRVENHEFIRSSLSTSLFTPSTGLPLETMGYLSCGNLFSPCIYARVSYAMGLAIGFLYGTMDGLKAAGRGQSEAWSYWPKQLLFCLCMFLILEVLAYLLYRVEKSGVLDRFFEKMMPRLSKSQDVESTGGDTMDQDH